MPWGKKKEKWVTLVEFLFQMAHLFSHQLQFKYWFLFSSHALFPNSCCSCQEWQPFSTCSAPVSLDVAQLMTKGCYSSSRSLSFSCMEEDQDNFEGGSKWEKRYWKRGLKPETVLRAGMLHGWCQQQGLPRAPHRGGLVVPPLLLCESQQ